MVKRLSCLPSKQAARVRLPFGVYHDRVTVFVMFPYLLYRAVFAIRSKEEH